MKNRLFAILMTLTLVLTYMPAIAFADNELSTQALSGTIGTCDWDATTDGVLTIHSGEIAYDENALTLDFEELWGNENFQYLFTDPEYREVYDEETDSFLDPPEEVLELPVITKVRIDGKVTLKNASFIFMGFTTVEEFDLAGLDTSSVQHMNYMFNGCDAAKTIDLSGFNTSNVTTMDRMFESCYNLETIDLSSFNTGNVSNMFGLFRDCNSLRSVNLSSFNTSKVTDMAHMFYGCSSLESVDLSSFQIMGNYSCNASEMFDECESLRQIKCGKWDESCNAEFPVNMVNEKTDELYAAGDLIPTGTGLVFVASDKTPEPDEPDEPTERKFKLGRDNCSFMNSSNKKYINAGFVGVKTHTFDTKYMSALEAKLKQSRRKSLHDAINAEWDGSCAGISATMGLVYNGVLSVSDISDNGKHGGSYFSMEYPFKNGKLNNRRLYNNLQYCMFAMQFGLSEDGHIAHYEDSDWVQRAAAHCVGADTAKYDLKQNLETFVKSAKEASANGKILVLGVSYEYTPKGKLFKRIIHHSISAVGYEYDSDRKKHIITLYDNNCADGYFTTNMTIDADYSAADLDIDAGLISTRKNSSMHVLALDLYDTDALDYYGKGSRMAKNVRKLSSSSESGTAIIEFPADTSFTIRNSKGEYVSNNKISSDNEDGYLEGDMDIIDVQHVVRGNTPYLALTVDSSETYTVDSIDGTYASDEAIGYTPPEVNGNVASACVSICSDAHYASIKTTDVDSITFDPNGSITVSPANQQEGKNFDFDAYLSLESADDASLNIHGNASTDMTITPSGDQVNIDTDKVDISKVECFANCRTDSVDAEHTSSGEIVIDATDTVANLSSISGFPIDEETVVIDDRDCKYTGRPCEPNAYVEGLTKGVDYTVTYKNNINAGTATVTVTGIGEYSGTVSRSFKIVKAADPGAAEAARKAEAAKKAEAARQGVYNKKIPKVKASKPAAKKTNITVKWKKLTKKQLKKSKATHYEIWVCPNKGFAKGQTIEKIVKKSKASVKVKGLKKNTKYYVKVRAIKYVGGVKHVGKWSQKTIKTKKK